MDFDFLCMLFFLSTVFLNFANIDFYVFSAMKNFISIGGFLLCLLFGVAAHAAKHELKHVHPSFWWSGMEEPQLQILLHGDQIGGCEVSLSSPSVSLVKVERPANSNYLLVYVDLSKASPQKFNILLRKSGSTIKVPYEIKAREQQNRLTFDASDVVYLLMPDRFANGNPSNDYVKGMREPKQDVHLPDARHGGDISGIVQHLDYLKDLGVTAFWHTPMLENDMKSHSYHGYGITDYYQIDARYGSNEEYKEMVAAAHRKGLKVIKDIVFNHCGSYNFLYVDRPADDWFNFNSKYVQTSYRIGAVSDIHAAEADKKLAQDGWFVEVMPDFNQKNPAVLTYLIQNSIWWIEYAGIDGIRQDTYPYADFYAMAQWCKAVDQQYPGFNIVGETWVNHNVGISYWQKNSKLAAPKNSYLPSVMDFPLMSLLNGVLDEETNEWDRGLARLYEYISQDMVYADPMHLLTFLDNHDTQRFAPNKEKALKSYRYRQALTLLLTLRGIPQLYYGDEIGMYADKSKGDGALRQNFPGGFKGDLVNGFTGKGLKSWQKEQFDFSRRLLNWRKGNDAIAKGSLKHFAVRNGTYVYAREYHGHLVTVIINGTDAPQCIDLQYYKEVLPKSSAYEVIRGKSMELGNKFQLGEREVLVLDFR